MMLDHECLLCCSVATVVINEVQVGFQFYNAMGSHIISPVQKQANICERNKLLEEEPIGKEA